MEMDPKLKEIKKLFAKRMHKKIAKLMKKGEISDVWYYNGSEHLTLFLEDGSMLKCELVDQPDDEVIMNYLEISGEELDKLLE